MATYLVVRSSEDPEPMYTRDTAAQLARISLELLRQCEREQLIRSRLMTGGGYGYSAADVRRLARIRRLREDLELDLAAVEVVLHLRRQVVELLRQIETMEQESARREQTLRNEIQRLRQRLAREAQWG